MSEVVADTHAIVWFLHFPTRLSRPATAALDAASRGRIYISAITLVEIAYLVEKGRLAEIVFDQLSEAVDDPASGIIAVPVTVGISRSLRSISRKLIPDMPDRIIAATALHMGLSLVTADSQIQSSGIATIW